MVGFLATATDYLQKKDEKIPVIIQYKMREEKKHHYKI